MKKKLYLIYIMMILIVTACQRDKTPNITTRIATDGLGINDKSFNASAWEGLLRFYGDSVGDEKNFGILYDVAICSDPTQYEQGLRILSEQGHDVLILTGFTFSNALRIVAEEYPNQKYLAIDIGDLPNKNVMNYAFAAEEGSYLVGVIAALQAQAEGVIDPQFGFIGGIECDMISNFETGYVEGIRSVMPNAKIMDYYIGSWTRPDIAAAQAKEWYDSGVYIIYTAAGMSGNGTIAEAVAHRKAGKNVWAIGVDKDQFGEGIYGINKSAVLTSMVKRVDNAVELGLNGFYSGQFTPGTKYLSLKDGAVGYTATNSELNHNVIKRVDMVQAEICSGRIAVTSIYNNRQASNDILQSIRHNTSMDK